MACSKNVFVQLRPSSKLGARILQHFQMYMCTLFVAMPSQSPSLPFDSVQVCLHGRKMRRFRPTGEYVVLHIFKYAVSAKGYFRFSFFFFLENFFNHRLTILNCSLELQKNFTFTMCMFACWWLLYLLPGIGTGSPRSFKQQLLLSQKSWVLPKSAALHSCNGKTRMVFQCNWKGIRN